MISLVINNLIKKLFIESCKKAQDRECGGVLFGQHVHNETFQIVEITSDIKEGSISRFLRDLKLTIKKLKYFFSKYKHRYTVFNYLGEWHSHPHFVLQPSSIDEETIRDIVMDSSVGANFVVLMLTQLAKNELKANAWVYFPTGIREECNLIFFDSENSHW